MYFLLRRGPLAYDKQYLCCGWWIYPLVLCFIGEWLPFFNIYIIIVRGIQVKTYGLLERLAEWRDMISREDEEVKLINFIYGSDGFNGYDFQE